MHPAVPRTELRRSLAAAMAAMALCLAAAAPALAAEDQACLACHGQEGMTKSFEKGDPVSLRVDGRAFAASVHGLLGCAACHGTGYAGRTGIYELLEIDDGLRAAIHGREGEQKLRELARARGFRTLHEDGARWVNTGVTSSEELLRVTREQ